MNARMLFCGCFVGFAALGGCDAAEPTPGDAQRHGQWASDAFTVDFDDCQEFAGLYPVPIANVAPHVPAQYTIASFDGVTASVVFRTAYCEGIAIDGGPSRSGIVSQIGVNVLPPEGEGDINNYTIHYGTDRRRLARKLRRAGVNAKFIPNLEFDYDDSDGTGEYFIENPRPQFAHVISGPASDPPPEQEPIPFVANWWKFGYAGDVVMETSIDELFQGDASQVLVTTTPNSLVADLLGGTVSAPTVFAIRGIIPEAVMDVRPVDL